MEITGFLDEENTGTQETPAAEENEKPEEPEQDGSVKGKSGRGNLWRIVKGLFFAPSGETSPSPKSTPVKIKVFAVIFVVLLAVIAVYYGYLMILKGEQYRKEAYEAQNRIFVTKARRGNIFDANGNPLAVTVDTYTVSVSRKEINEYGEKNYKDGTLEDYRKLVAKGISDRCGAEYGWILEELGKEGNAKNVAVNIDAEKGESIKKWVSDENIKGVTVTSTTSRYYPYGSLASHVIGFTGTDNYGLVCGVEVALNKELAGVDGKVLATVEKNGNAIAGKPKTVVQELENGLNANLTIDKNIQQIAEEVLEEAVRDFKVVEGGAVIVMDPETGSVLAMASYPSFDLNDPMTVPDGLREKSFFAPADENESFLAGFVWKNRALSVSYEPGSTFKAITAAVALEENVVGVEEELDDSPLSLSGWTIHCSTSDDEENGHGSETFRLAVANSCNPIMARVALRAGVNVFYSYVRAFGFYNKTNILLSGETVGVMHQDPKEIDLAVTAFGQRFTITPIQLATAYCAIANGGTLYEPRIVASLTDENGRVVKEYAPKEVRKVISANTSKTVLELLEGVVTIGTGNRAYVSGYKVAGKTGTAETVDTLTTGRYIVSFSAVAPSDRPEIVVMVMMDHPTAEDISGSRMGAWAAGKIVKRTLEYMQVKKIYTEDDFARIRNVYYLNDLTGMSFLDAMNEIKLSSRLYNVIIVGDPETHPEVARMYPEAKVYTAREATQVLYFTDDPDANAGYVKVPDLVGMTLCEAHNAVTSLELNMDCRAGEIITSQSIDPGTLVEKGTVIVMKAVNDPEG